MKQSYEQAGQLPPPYPLCFDSLEQYKEWRRVGITAREECSICSDCTAKYKHAMQSQGRCDGYKATAHFTLFSNKSRPSAGTWRG